MGLTVRPSVASLPQVPDLAVIATPAETVPCLIGELGERGTRAAIIISAGFSELGERGHTLQQAHSTQQPRSGGEDAQQGPAPAAGGERSARGGHQAPMVSMSDAILKAVQAHGDGATANAVARARAAFISTARRSESKRNLSIGTNSGLSCYTLQQSVCGNHGVTAPRCRR
jgi:hypothetical protein